jgi:hypothetical protein
MTITFRTLSGYLNSYQIVIGRPITLSMIKSGLEILFPNDFKKSQDFGVLLDGDYDAINLARTYSLPEASLIHAGFMDAKWHNDKLRYITRKVGSTWWKSPKMSSSAYELKDRLFQTVAPSIDEYIKNSDKHEHKKIKEYSFVAIQALMDILRQETGITCLISQNDDLLLEVIENPYCASDEGNFLLLWGILDGFCDWLVKVKNSQLMKKKVQVISFTLK